MTPELQARVDALEQEAGDVRLVLADILELLREQGAAAGGPERSYQQFIERRRARRQSYGGDE